MEKKIIKLVESVEVYNLNKDKKSKVKARIDTGAAISSIDIKLAAKLGLGPIIDHANIRNSHGKSVRAVIEGVIVLKGEELKERFTLANRSEMKYDVLVGRNILRNDFLIDPTE